MQNSEKETYKDYLVRKVTEEISNVFKQKMDETKKELLEINYKVSLENTEEILKNMKEGENMLAVVEMMRKEAEKERKLDFSNGRKTGLKEGIIKIVKRLLKLNYDTNSIKEITGLKEEEIEKLRNVDKK